MSGQVENKPARTGHDASRRILRLIAACLLAIAGLTPAHAQQTMSLDGGAERVLVSTQWLHEKAQPDGQNVLAVVFSIQPHWHIASDAGQKVDVPFSPVFTAVEVSAGDDRLTFGPTQYPTAKKYPVGGFPTPIPVFDGRTVVYLPVVIAGDAEPGEVTVKVKITYQACDDKVCEFPVDLNRDVSFTVVPTGEAASAPNASGLFDGFDPAAFADLMGGGAEAVADPGVAEDVVEDAEPQEAKTVDFLLFEVDPSGTGGFIALLIMAAVGGALLNFTPCVLPVIPIKILGLAQTAGNRRKTLALGTVMALGVVAFWLGLGVVIAGVSEFTASNQLFQYPWFSISVGIIIAVLAVGMCGLFAVRLPNFVYSVSPKHDSYPGSFGFGIMTAVLSTPCTAPFMGGAAAWAATQDPSKTLLTFAAIGFGMALPYFILSANPKLVDALPKTGPGSELLKQVMGLLMLAAAAFFVGAGISGMLSDGTRAAPKGHWWVVAAFVAVAGLWLIVRVFKATPSPAKQSIFVVLGLVTIVASGVGAMSLTAKDDAQDAPIKWVYYTPQRFEQALADGRVVLLDFTADWCANCKVLEHTVLNTDTVTSVLDGEDYIAMKVDLTGGYPDGKAILKETGSVTIPWLVIFSPDGREVFKANWYTATQITDALNDAKQPVLAASSD